MQYKYLVFHIIHIINIKPDDIFIVVFYGINNNEHTKHPVYQHVSHKAKKSYVEKFRKALLVAVWWLLIGKNIL
jgi:hypothetical protein